MVCNKQPSSSQLMKVVLRDGFRNRHPARTATTGPPMLYRYRLSGWVAMVLYTYTWYCCLCYCCPMLVASFTTSPLRLRLSSVPPSLVHRDWYHGQHPMDDCSSTSLSSKSKKSPSSLGGDGHGTADDDHDERDCHLMLTSTMMEYFQGDFDNYYQVLQDRQEDRLPREGGGHEHIHCTLIPLSSSSRLAAFYFDGLPQRIFRFRYYQLQPPAAVEVVANDEYSSKTKTTTISSSSVPKKEIRMEMRLYTLNPKLEGLLRTKSEEPLLWPEIFNSFVRTNANGNDQVSGSSKSITDANHYPPPPTVAVDRLPNCEVSWSMEMDPIQHAYVAGSEKENMNDTQQLHGVEETGTERGGVHAIMVHGEAIVDSTMIPGAKIRILDQLSLFPNVFYINDRGLDPQTGAFIYGNQRDVPYRLDRVTRIGKDNDSGDDTTTKRCVVHSDLEWTLGPKWRNVEHYETKMDAIGGPSTRMNVDKKG